MKYTLLCCVCFYKNTTMMKISNTIILFGVLFALEGTVNSATVNMDSGSIGSNVSADGLRFGNQGLLRQRPSKIFINQPNFYKRLKTYVEALDSSDQPSENNKYLEAVDNILDFCFQYFDFLDETFFFYLMEFDCKFLEFYCLIHTF